MGTKDNNKPIKLYFLTGFLGSGKTTLLTNMLKMLAKQKKKAGVIVNEFGQIGVDGRVIKHKGIDMVELNDGQIFCGCIAGKFVKTIASFADLPLDYLIVESSGMANPASIDIVLKDVKTLTGDDYDYQGMICMIDPVRFLTLVKTVNAIEEQVIRSQFMIINKTDLVDDETIEQVVAKIHELNPTAPIIKTSFAVIPDDLFDLDLQTKAGENENPNRQIFVPYKRPKHYLIKTKEIVTKKAIQNFIESIVDDTFRIKGFIKVEDGWIHLDVVNDDIQLKPVTEPPEEDMTEFVVISSIWEEIAPKLDENWRKHVNVPVEIKENVFSFAKK